MHATLKPIVLATLLALSAQAHAACDGNVMLGSIDSGVPDREVDGTCINDLILDGPNDWGSHGQFVRHVTEVTDELREDKDISKKERKQIVKAAAQSEVGKTLTVKLIGFNDFHGAIDSTGLNWTGIAAGGADWVAAHVAALKAANPNNAVVSAGDLIGATPLVSALFHDEPTIEAMNRVGLDFNAVGNHEFDEGKDELLRMQHGGCHPTDTNSCQGAIVGTPVPFEGAKFKFLAANVLETATGKTLFPAYAIKNFKGNKVAFIGMTLEGTPTIVTPSGVAGLEFKDEADTVNALIAELKRKRVETIVVLIHEGGVNTGGSSAYNACPGISGPIVDIVARLDDAVDAVISGHTHNAYVCSLPNSAGRAIPVTSAGSNGRILTDMDLSIDTKSRDVAAVAARNLITNHSDVTPVAELTTLVTNYKDLSAPIANQVIGQITADLPHNAANGAGEVILGDVIADAQLNATQPAGFGEAVVAFMNPGGIRSPGLTYVQSGTEGDGNVTYGEAFTAQPFGNSLVTMTLTGAQLDSLLRQQFPGCGQSAGTRRMLQVSDGFSYTWNGAYLTVDGGGKEIVSDCSQIVVPGSLAIDGVAVDPAASYRVTVNSFLADGGDNFVVLKDGTDRLGGAQDLDALIAWFASYGIVDPTTYANAQQRIQRIN